MNALESRRARRFTDGVSIGVLTRIFHRDLVDEVLIETGSVEQQSRSLPARLMVYYVLALCLFFEDAYEEVMRKLVNGLRFLDTWLDEWQVPTTGAISQARDRLGEEPFAELFERVARPLARPGTRGAWFRGWRVMAVDGVVLNVADTPANLEAFIVNLTKLEKVYFRRCGWLGLANVARTRSLARRWIHGRFTSESY